MKMIKCPSCGVFSQEPPEVCKCGYNFKEVFKDMSTSEKLSLYVTPTSEELDSASELSENHKMMNNKLEESKKGMGFAMKCFLYVIGFLFLVVASVIGTHFGKMTTQRTFKDNKEISLGGIKYKLPMRIDEETLIYDFSKDEKNKAMLLTYKLDKRVKSETIRSMILGDIRKKLKETLCKDTDFLRDINAGFKYKIRYIDMNNQPITSYFLDYRDCQ